MKRFSTVSSSNDGGDQSNVVTSQWTPRVDIKEDKALRDPWLTSRRRPKDIGVHMDKGILSIRGRQHKSEQRAGRDYTRVESAMASCRRYALPDGTRCRNITAAGISFGSAEISIPKKPEATPGRNHQPAPADTRLDRSRHQPEPAAGRPCSELFVAPARDGQWRQRAPRRSSGDRRPWEQLPRCRRRRAVLEHRGAGGSLLWELHACAVQGLLRRARRGAETSEGGARTAYHKLARASTTRTA